jgi:protein AIR1/2
MVRYFVAPAEDQKQARFVCKRCGAESEHRTNECPVLIVRIVHITRTCALTICSV